MSEAMLSDNAHLILGGILLALGVFNILLGTVLKQWAFKWLQFTFWFRGVNVTSPNALFYIRTIGSGILLIVIALMVMIFGAGAVKFN